MKETAAENIVFRITSAGQKVHVSAMCRPPNKSARDFEEELYSQLDKIAKGVVVSDINVNWFAAESWHVKDVLRSQGWSNQVNDITRRQSRTNIDHIYTNISALKVELLDLKLSDHMAVRCELDIGRIEPPVRLVSRTNYDRLRELLNAEDWSDSFRLPNSKPTDVSTELWKRALREQQLGNLIAAERMFRSHTSRTRLFSS